MDSSPDWVKLDYKIGTFAFVASPLSMQHIRLEQANLIIISLKINLFSP
jgi:hypothetical protein